jgi:hypothetical protein
MDPLRKLLDMDTEHGLLHPIGVASMKLRTSMYADDTMLFLRPHASYVQHLHHMLQLFGAATGLTTNITKSEIIPIRCEDMDMPTILGTFQAATVGLPYMYLGLPLRLGRPQKEAGNLPNWMGKLLNKAGHHALVNSVLFFVVTCHMMVFHLSKWALKKINRIRRRFLWHGADSARHGCGLVHWKRVTQPKRLGGLSVMDLDHFNKALRLRWLWLLWVDDVKPWNGLPPPASNCEMALFRPCTEIRLGDGRKVSFWHDRWIDRTSRRRCLTLHGGGTSRWLWPSATEGGCVAYDVFLPWMK